MNPLQSQPSAFQVGSPQNASQGAVGAANYVGGAVASGMQGAAKQAIGGQNWAGLPQTNVLNQNAPLAQGQVAMGNVNMPSTIKTTSTGGTAFPASMVAGATNTSSTPTINTQTANPQNLADYIIKNTQTPNGGSLAYSNAGGISSYNPNANYLIPTGGSIPSDALNGSVGVNDVMGQQNQYQDLVNGLAQAQGYSPAYLQALQQQYGAQAHGAYLGSVGAGIGANVATGNGFTGYSQGQAQAQGNIEQALNTQQEALNTQQQTGANIALNAQELARTGNIAAAQTMLSSSPVGMSGQNAINQYNSLQTLYPGANIPSYNPALSPEQNQQIANQAVASSPSYQSQFLSQYSTPGGGTGLYSKLDTGALQTNPNGTLSLVSGAAASLGGAESSALNTQIQNYNNLAIPYQAANSDFSAMQSFIQQAGINQSDVPVINQIQNAVKAKLVDPGAVSAFQTYITSLRANYTQLLGARGETPTDAGNAALALIPDDLNPSQMAQVQQALNTNGGNILTATGNQIASITSQLPGGAQPAGASTTQVSNGQNPFSSQSFFGQ